MVLKYVNDERFFAQEASNIANWGRRRVKTGCEVTEKTVPDMSVDVSGGVVLFGTTVVNVTATNLVIAPADPSADRIDLVVVDSSGVVSIIDGSAYKDPDPTLVKPENYDSDLYVLLARVYVDDLVTSIVNAKIKDLRLTEEGPAGAVPGGLAKHIEPFTSLVTVNVNHNLNDLKPQVQALNNSGELIIPDTVIIVDANNLTVTFVTAQTGTIVVHGGQFTSTGTTSRTETTVSSVLTFDFFHSLGVEPDILAIDTTVTPNEKVEPQKVEHLDSNTTRVTFGLAFTGKLVAIGGTTQVTDSTKVLKAGDTMSGNLATTSGVTIGTISNTNFAGDGNLITNINATNIATGIVSDSRLSVNVALKNINNTFSSENIFNNKTTFNNATIFELRATDPAGIDLIQGRVWFNTIDNQLKLYNGTSIVILG